MLRHVCLSVLLHGIGVHWTDFYGIWKMSNFPKSVEKLYVSLKSDKNNGYFTWRPIDIFHHTSLNSSQKLKMFQNKEDVEKIKTHILCSTTFFRKQCNLWDMEIHCTAGQYGPGSVVGIATAYGLDGPGIESRLGRDFPNLSRPALRTTQPPVQWVPGLSRG